MTSARKVLETLKGSLSEGMRGGDNVASDLESSAEIVSDVVNTIIATHRRSKRSGDADALELALMDDAADKFKDGIRDLSDAYQSIRDRTLR